MKIWYNNIRKISALSSARIEYRIPIPLVMGSNPLGRAKQNPLSKEGGFCLYYSLFIIHNSLFIYLKRILNE